MRRTRKLDRAALILGAATAALSATAWLPAATAFADDYSWEPVPNSLAQIEYTTGIPPIYQEVEGFNNFYFEDPKFATDLNPDGVTGSFGAAESEISTSFGISNEELLVTGPDLGFAPPPYGSVLDALNFGNGYENIYTDLVGLGPNGTNLITDIFDTPLGDFAIPTTFDAAALTMGDLLF